MIPESINTGSLVAIENDARKTSGAGSGVALVLESRRNDARILTLDPERSAWVPRRSLRPATAAEAGASQLASAADAFRLLRGVSVEVALNPGGSLRVVVGHGPFGPALVDAVRAHFGDRLAGWRIRPAGLHRIESVMEFGSVRTSSPPAT